jgi:hypothetical protein
MCAHTKPREDNYNATLLAHAAAAPPDQQGDKAVEVPQLLWQLHDLVVRQVQLVEINRLKSTPERPLDVPNLLVLHDSGDSAPAHGTTC